MSEPLTFVNPASPTADSIPFSADDPMALPPLDPNAGFVTKVQHYYVKWKLFKDDKFRNLRPWKEFLDRTQFSVPSKLEAFARISRNYTYFQSNYFAVVGVMSLYILMTNSIFMIVMLMCMALYYWIKMKAEARETILIIGQEYSPNQAYIALLIGTIVLFYLTNGSSTVFWLVTSAIVVVAGHAATRRPVEDQPHPFSLV